MPLTLDSAIASRENQVQLVFSAPIYFSTLLDSPDGSDPAKYAVLRDPSTTGLDGSPARAVGVIGVELGTSVFDATKQAVNLNLDRPLTAYPAVYSVTAQGVFTADLVTLLAPNPTTLTIFGVHKSIAQPQLDTPTPLRDFANAQTRQGAVGSTLDPDALTLGTLAYDETGDYAVDDRMAGFKKRMLRRIISQPGGFLHLGMRYGVGIKSFGKQLASASVRASLAAQIEKQVALEPEAERVKATIVESTTPGLYRLQLLVRLRGGLTSRYELPFPRQ